MLCAANTNVSLSLGNLKAMYAAHQNRMDELHAAAAASASGSFVPMRQKPAPAEYISLMLCAFLVHTLIRSLM